MPEARFNPKAIEGYDAREAMAQLPPGTKFVSSAYLDNYRSGSGTLRVRVYTVGPLGVTENIRGVFRRFDEINRSFLYTVIESAEGEVFYRAGESRPRASYATGHIIDWGSLGPPAS